MYEKMPSALTSVGPIKDTLPRAMACPLQHGPVAQRMELTSTRADKKPFDGPEAEDAQAIKPDSLIDAGHSYKTRQLNYVMLLAYHSGFRTIFCI